MFCFAILVKRFWRKHWSFENTFVLREKASIRKQSCAKIAKKNS